MMSNKPYSTCAITNHILETKDIHTTIAINQVENESD